MGSDCSTCIMGSVGYMIVFAMLIASTWSKTTENFTQDVNVRGTCYTEADCGSYEICCEWECTNYDYGCDETYCSSYISCPYSWQICCAGICLNEDYGCHVTTNFAPSTSPSPSPDDALWGIGIAAVVASFVGPIVCCCCCCGCGLFFILSSRKKAPRSGTAARSSHDAASANDAATAHDAAIIHDAATTRDADNARWTGSATRISYWRVCHTTSLWTREPSWRSVS